MTDRSIDTITRDVTLRGETRSVTITICTFEDGHQRCASSSEQCAYQKGNGKIWFRTLDFINNNGRTDWTPRRTETIMNRAAYRLIGWADQYEGYEKHHSNHNSA
jgi:hypothetical protein